MKFFIGLLCLMASTLSLSRATGSTVDTRYQVIMFPVSLKETIRKNASWSMCGDYFANVGTKEQKVVLFGFKDRASGPHTAATFAFTVTGQIAVSVNEKAVSPLVAMTGSGSDTEFLLVMNMRDYTLSLPCITEGTRT